MTNKRHTASADRLATSGFRWPANRAGLDPIENQLNRGRFTGLLLKALFTSRLHTRNPLVLLILVLFALGSLGLTFLKGAGMLWVWQREGVSAALSYLWSVACTAPFTLAFGLAVLKRQNKNSTDPRLLMTDPCYSVNPCSIASSTRIRALMGGLAACANSRRFSGWVEEHGF